MRRPGPLPIGLRGGHRSAKLVGEENSQALSLLISFHGLDEKLVERDGSVTRHTLAIDPVSRPLIYAFVTGARSLGSSPALPAWAAVVGLVGVVL